MNPWETEPETKEKVTRPRIDEPKIWRSGKKIESNIFYTLAPIYYVSWIFGLFPVKFSKNSTGQYIGRLQNVYVLYGVLILMCVVGAQCWGLYRDMRDGQEYSSRISSQMGIISTGGDILSITGVFVSAIVGASFRWRHLLSALDVIVHVDEKLGISTSKNLRKGSIIVIVCSFAYIITISTLDFISWNHSFQRNKAPGFEDKGPINYVPMYFMHIVNLAFETQYAILLFNVGERFLKLNKAIENLMKTNWFFEDKGMGLAFLSSNIGHSRMRRSNKVPNPIVTDEGDGYTLNAINELIALHGKLCNCIEYLNKAYGFALLMATISCFIHLTITPYNLCNVIFSDDTEWYVLIYQNFWIVFHSYLLLLLVQPCYMVALKAKDTGTLVSQAMVQNWNPRAKKQWEIFFLQVIHRPVEFTAYGLFYLNRGLLTTMAGGVTTYLIILMQFQSAESGTTDTKKMLKHLIDLQENSSTYKKSSSLTF